MAPINTALVIALFALSGVDAKRKDKVQYSLYPSRDCNGHPLEGKIYDLKLEKDQKSSCHVIPAAGIRFHNHTKTKYNQWQTDVNDGRDICKATFYKGLGCLDANRAYTASLPGAIGTCTTLDSGVSSVKFSCEPNSAYAAIHYDQEIEMPVTSWYMSAIGRAQPSVYTTKINVTRQAYQGTDTVTEFKLVTPTAPGLHPRADPTHKAVVEPRKQYNIKGVWMLHPWTGSALCFKCWTKKELEVGKFHCRSGHFHKYDVDCGPMPTPVAPIIKPIVATDFVEFFYTTTDQYRQVPLPTPLAEKRSPHKAVQLEHPWMGGTTVCADAEWENSGKSRAEVRIQHIKALRKCSGKKPLLDINIGLPETTVAVPITVTATTTLVTRPTWALPIESTIGVPSDPAPTVPLSLPSEVPTIPIVPTLPVSTPEISIPIPTLPVSFPEVSLPTPVATPIVSILPISVPVPVPIFTILPISMPQISDPVPVVSIIPISIPQIPDPVTVTVPVSTSQLPLPTLPTLSTLSTLPTPYTLPTLPVSIPFPNSPVFGPQIGSHPYGPGPAINSWPASDSDISHAPVFGPQDGSHPHGSLHDSVPLLMRPIPIPPQ